MGFLLHNVYLAANLLVFRFAKLILQIFGARVLSVVNFGMFSYLYSLMDIWVHFFGAGLDVVASRAHGVDPEWRRLWRQAALFKGILALTGAAAGLVFLPWPYSLLFGLWHVFFMQSKLAYGYVNTLLYPKGLILAGVLAESGLVLTALAATPSLGLIGFVLAFVVERGIEAGALWFFAFQRESQLQGPWSVQGLWSAFRGLLPPAFLIWATQLLGVLAARLDTLMVKKFLGLEDLALYSLSFRAAEAPLFIFAAMADSTLAYFIRHRDEQERLYVQNLKRAFVVGLACAVGLVLFAYFAAPWVLGSKYAGIAPILAGYSWVLALRGTNMVSSSFLMASGRERILLASSGTGLVFNALANLVAIPLLGIKGPVLVAIGTESIIFVIRSFKTLNRWALPLALCLLLAVLSASFLYMGEVF